MVVDIEDLEALGMEGLRKSASVVPINLQEEKEKEEEETGLNEQVEPSLDNLLPGAYGETNLTYFTIPLLFPPL